MKFSIQDDQPHQLEAIGAVLDLFEGALLSELVADHPGGPGDPLTFLSDSRAAIEPGRFLENLRAVQSRNRVRVDNSLELLVGDEPSHPFPNISIEMETGTGKTYVFIRTALELARRFGLRKYVVVVPSVAIREGVLAALHQYGAHLAELVGIPLRFAEYDAQNLAQLRQFALSTACEFLIITVDSFSKVSNIIQRASDRFFDRRPIDYIRGVRPIVIVDEPQRSDTEVRTRAIANLSPLLTLRYSATHRREYNVVYRLSPHDAYRLGLVKQIEVLSVDVSSAELGANVRVDEVRSTGSRIDASVTVRAWSGKRYINEKLRLRSGDSLALRTGRSEYDGWDVDELDLLRQTVSFTNGITLASGQSFGESYRELQRRQIEMTVDEHVAKQDAVVNRGIKVLSLFFIDRVDDYAQVDGWIRVAFEDAYRRALEKRGGGQHASAVHSGYFSRRIERGGERLVDSSGVGEVDREAYDLILRDKARLLSFDEPVSFIFSHSALREGWDNPNVFQICTLARSYSNMKKRQEIGRGVRLAVNQLGERTFDPAVNVLTVVANETYDEFVSALQNEIDLESPIGSVRARELVHNARTRVQVVPRREILASAEFQIFWNAIARRSRYRLHIDSDEVVAAVSLATEWTLSNSAAAGMIVKRAAVDVKDGEFAARLMATRASAMHFANTETSGLVDEICAALRESSGAIRLKRQTVARIVETIPRRLVARSPERAVTAVIAGVRDFIGLRRTNSVSYEVLPEMLGVEGLLAPQISWGDRVEPAQKAIHTNVEVDSDEEREVVKALEQADFVRFFLKLPHWFTIPTPFGGYRPDWAIAVEDAAGQIRAIVRESKGAVEEDQLRISEERKVRCGLLHFEALGVDFRVVTSGSLFDGLELGIGAGPSAT